MFYFILKTLKLKTMILSKLFFHSTYNRGTVRIHNVLNGLLRCLVIAWLHLSVHGGQLHLPLEVHLHCTVPDRGILEVFIGISQLLKKRETFLYYYCWKIYMYFHWVKISWFIKQIEFRRHLISSYCCL